MRIAQMSSKSKSPKTRVICNLESYAHQVRIITLFFLIVLPASHLSPRAQCTYTAVVLPASRLFRLSNDVDYGIDNAAVSVSDLHPTKTCICGRVSIDSFRVQPLLKIMPVPWIFVCLYLCHLCHPLPLFTGVRMTPSMWHSWIYFYRERHSWRRENGAFSMNQPVSIHRSFCLPEHLPPDVPVIYLPVSVNLPIKSIY